MVQKNKDIKSVNSCMSVKLDVLNLNLGLNKWLHKGR